VYHCGGLFVESPLAPPTQVNTFQLIFEKAASMAIAFCEFRAESFVPCYGDIDGRRWEGKRPSEFFLHIWASLFWMRDCGAMTANETAQPKIGIFWLVRAGGEPQLLTASCPLSQAEPYGDFLTFGPGHYEVWDGWRISRKLSAAARAVVSAYEYEDWPRGRIVLDKINDRFVLYADRQLMDAAHIAEICRRFNLPEERTRVERDAHYRSTERISSS
jgi:hypothetical protein